MNNDLERFSEERLKELESLGLNARLDLKPSEGISLIRIALSVKQAKPTFEEWLSSRTGTIEVDCGCVTTEAFYHWLKVAYEATPQPAHTEQAKSAANEFLPENLDRALTIMGVALPESKEEFNFQAQRWTQRLIDRVIRYENEFQVQESHGEKHGCKWKPDEDSVYSTSCGNEWQFTEGGLEDNQIKFCPYCSGKISAPKPESE